MKMKNKYHEATSVVFSIVVLEKVGAKERTDV